MEINLKKGDKVSTIQKIFSNEYPYLKLQFYKIPHQHGDGTSNTLIWPESTSLENIRLKHRVDKIHIDPRFTVAEVEKSFYEIFGLSVQIFRQSGELWLQTTKTDSWSLEKQNEQGRLSTVEIKEEEKDYGLMDVE